MKKDKREQTKVKLDNLDNRLLTELQQNAYCTHVELAQILGTSKTTVTRRLRQLLKEGVLKIVGVVDPQKIGLNTSAIIGINVDFRDSDSVIQQLTNKPEINFIALVTGRYDIVIAATLKSTTELARFVTKEIASIPGVRESETLVALEIKKQTHALAI